MSNTPYLVGSASAVSGGSVTLTVPVTTSVADQDSIVVGVLITVAGVTALVTDTAGNNYNNLHNTTTSTAAQLEEWECDGASPLVAGTDTISITYSANTSAQGAIAVGDNGVSAADISIGTGATGAAPNSGSTGILGQPEEHAIAFITDANAGGTPTWAAPFSTHVLTTVTAGTVAKISAAFTTVTATTALTASGTITSAAWSAGVNTTKVTPVTVSGVLSDGVENEAYSQALTAVGGSAGAYTWAVTGGALPTGLALSAGVISGTPTVSGSFPVTVTATDAAGLMSGSVTFTIVILSDAGLVVVPSQLLPGNMLVRNDSDFSSGTIGNWTAQALAGSLAVSTHARIEGAQSLKWTATGNGVSSVQSGFINVTAGTPLVVSGYLLPPGTQDCFIGIDWYTSAGSLIREDLGVDNPSTTIAWQPLNAMVTAPATTAKCKITVQVDEAVTGDVMHLDLVYLATAQAQILIDFSVGTTGNASTAGNDFADVTPWVRMDQGINLSRGRQDGISEIQAGSASFSLQNDGGLFTRFKSTSLAAVLGGDTTLQRRCQINMTDEAGVWHTRFDGPLSGIQYTLTNNGLTNIVQVQATDVLAPLQREDSLSCWTREQVLADGPILHYALNDTGTSGATAVAAETSGNNGPSLRIRNTDATLNATIAFADSTGGVETLADAIAPSSNVDGSEFWAAGTNQPTSFTRGLDPNVSGPISTPLQNVTFKPTLVTETGTQQFVGNTGFSLRTPLAPEKQITPNAVGLDYSFELFVTVDPYIAAHNTSSFNYGPFCLMSLADSGTGYEIIAGIQCTNASDHLNFAISLYKQPPSFTRANFTANTTPVNVGFIDLGYIPDTHNPVPHHAVITITGDPSAPVVNGYWDGAPVDATGFTLPMGQTFDTLILGGEFGGYGTHYGSMSCFSVYNSVLSQGQVTQHCRLGQYGMWEATTDDCIARLSTFANIPPYWSGVTIAENHFGLSLTEYMDITGSTPISAMQTYEQAEQGLLFVDAMGCLQFHTRDWRMGYGAPDLLLPPDTFDSSMGFEVIDQFMVNEQGVSSAVFTTGTGFVNAASQAEYGTYATSTANSPTSLPLISWSRAYTQLGLAAFDFWATPNMTDYAAFAANSRADPWLLPGTLNFDLKTLSKASTGIGISDLYNLEIDNMVAPSGTLPASFPDANLSREWFIEGINETISNTARTIQFYTSPAEAQRCWQPGDATYGVLGSTTRLGVSATDTNAPAADAKDVSHDGGGPYWPPAVFSGLNNPNANGHDFVGANDLRGLTDSARRMIHPPAFVVGSTTNQNAATGALASPQAFWDTVYVDTEGSFGLVPGWPNWYVVTVPGYYDLDGALSWHSGTASLTTMQGYFIIAQAAAQRVAEGSATPTTNGIYVCPVGSQLPPVSGSTVTPGNNLSTRIYLGLGDMVGLAAQQSTGATQTLSNPFGGSMFSGIYRGVSTSDDQVQLSSTITGGTVSSGGGKGGTTGGTPPANQTGSRGATVVTATKSYGNSHTYSYYGSTLGYKRRNSDGICYQGNPQAGIGSETSQITWPTATIISDLAGATVKSVRLTGHNQHTWFHSGGVLVLGYGNTGGGAGSWNPSTGGGHRGVGLIAWAQGATKTVNLPVSFVSALLSGAKYFSMGAPNDNSLEHYGFWNGGSNAWSLSITYTKPA